MRKCIICRKDKSKLYDGICEECLGKGANISMLSAIQDDNKEVMRKIEKRVAQGKIVRLM
jgi:hypothetical protein|tara:strand:+ start:1218 stop:1397 length:180 start_codon:yes stop_codon:yes gene_type:complete